MPGKRQTFLLLQGPVSPFFSRLAGALELRGHRVLRVNLCVGDWLFWRRPGAVNYRGRLADWPRFVRGLMQREGVTDLVFLGEQRPYQQAAAAEARALGVTVTATDFGYLRPDWIVLERDGLNGLSRFPRDPAAVRKLAAEQPPAELKQRYSSSFPRQAAWEVIYHLSNYFLRALYPHYRSHQIDNPVVAYVATGLRLLNAGRQRRRAVAALEAAKAAGERYWLFPMQMEVDYSIRAYSTYSGMEEPLRAVIGSFARHAPEGRLFIKVHPLDPGLKRWPARIRRWAREAGVEDRVTYLDGGDLSAMIRGAEGVVTVNSTVGLTAIQAGRPTLALGQALYDVEGLTFRGGLDRFWREAAPPDPGLAEAFVSAAAAMLQVRGDYYLDPGLEAGAHAAAERLEAEARASIDAAIERAKAVGDAEPGPRASGDLHQLAG